MIRVYSPLSSVISRWKAKCKKLEKQLSFYQHGAEEASVRSDRLIKELEMTKNQSSLTAHQIEHLKREFNTLLVRNKTRIPVG